MLSNRSLLVLALMSLSFDVCAQPTQSAATPAPKTIEERVSDLEKEIKDIKKRGKFEDVALDKANAASSEVLGWSQAKILEIYSYNFMNYQDVIKYIKDFFTQSGYDSYLKALEDSKNKDILQDQKLIVYAVPAGGAEVEKEGVVDGIYQWTLKVPLLVSYVNDKGTIKRKLDVEVIVVRLPNDQSARGYAIHAIRAKEVTEPTVSNPASDKIDTPKTSETAAPLDKKPEALPLTKSKK